MKIQSVLYYRYLFRQSFIVLVVSVLLSLIIDLVLFLTRFVSISNNPIIFTVGLLIWLLPIFVFICSMSYFLSFKKCKLKLKNKDIYNLMSNKIVRQSIVKKGIRIKVLFPKKNQIADFFKALEEEITKQKQILKIKNEQQGFLLQKNSKILSKSLEEIDDVVKFVLDIVYTKRIQYIFLDGEIGSGKTTFVKHFAKAIGEQNNVVSPTFNKMFVYDKFVHIDAYNMTPNELEFYKDFFEDKIIIIEWSNKLNIVEIDKFVSINISWSDKKRNYEVFWKV